MKTFYDFIEDWWENCETCPHCGATYPEDQGNNFVLCGEGMCLESEVYTEEVIEAYWHEEEWKE